MNLIIGKFDLSNLEPQSYIELARDLINRVEGIDLQSNPDNRRPALMQLDASGKAYFLVNIKGAKRLNDAEGLIEVISNIENDLSRLKPVNYILIYYSHLSEGDSNKIIKAIKGRYKVKFQQFDLSWIENKLLEFPDIARKFKLTKQLSSEINDNAKLDKAVVEMLDKSYVFDKKRITVDAERFTDEFVTIVRENEFYFEKAREVLQRIKAFDYKVLKGVSGESPNTPFKLLLSIWEDKGKLKPKEFEVELERRSAKFIFPLYTQIIEFLSYINIPSLDGEKLNQYEDGRVIAKTGARQDHLVFHFLQYAINGFKGTPNTSKRVLNRAISYIENPSEKFNILSDKHRLLISQFFLGKQLAGKQFHNSLKKYFDEMSFNVANSENATCLYTSIIYDKTIVAIWQKKSGGLAGEDSHRIDSDDDFELLDNRKDKIPFHLDQVVNVDKLGREPVAKAFVNLIKKDVFIEKLDHSFMVHLQGEWGSGKSSFLKFIENNLTNEKEKWIVVNYNAWLNQHISPPWWTLIDQLYRQSICQLNKRAKFNLYVRENLRRIIWYSGWQKAQAFVLTLGFVVVLGYYGESIIDFVNNETIKVENVNKQEKGLTLEVFTKLFISIVSCIGFIYSFSKFISTPFFMKNSSEAISFVNRASDPMTKIRSHFNKLVDSINSNNPNRQLAVFIDDIDRCNQNFIVELLEGIQTLFKEKRVLYIVAGDKSWITKSFGNAYKELSSNTAKQERLGELFLEKAFQLSFRMPNVSESAKKQFWNHIIGMEEDAKFEITESMDKLEEIAQAKLREAISSSKEDITNPDFMKKIENDFQVSSDVVSSLVIEEKSNDSEEIKHLLTDFYVYIDSNPRSIIRLANTYTMTRYTLIAERKNISPEKIFRWLIIEDLLPEIRVMSETTASIDLIQSGIENECINNTKLKEICIELLLDTKEKKGGPLVVSEIIDIKGL